MVLQRDKNVAVFGTGTAGESVRVSLPAQNRTVSGCVGGDGTWCVYLPPLTAGTGMTLEVAGAENQLVYTDVAVGEVWLAGGQSNMEFMLKDAKGGAEALQHCAESGVRCFRVPRNTFPDAAYAQEFAESRWELATPETAGPAPWVSKARFVPPVCTASCCAGSCRTPFGDSGIIRGRTTTFGRKRMPRCSGQMEFRQRHFVPRRRCFRFCRDKNMADFCLPVRNFAEFSTMAEVTEMFKIFHSFHRVFNSFSPCAFSAVKKIVLK